MDANSSFLDPEESTQAKNKEDSPDKLSRVKSHLGSLPQVKRAEVLENFLAAGIPLRKIDHLRGLLEAGGQHLTKSSGISELFPTVHAMAKKDLLNLRLAQPGAPGVSTCTMPGTTTPSSSMVLYPSRRSYCHHRSLRQRTVGDYSTSCQDRHRCQVRYRHSAIAGITTSWISKY